MPRSGTDPFHRDLGLPFQEIEGQIVIVVPARREVHQLNVVGSFLWNCLEEKRTVSDLVGLLCNEFEVAPETAERDVRAFLTVLEDHGLLTPAMK